MLRFREALQQVSMAIVSCDVLVPCEVLICSSHYFWSSEINPDGPLILVHETYARMFVEGVRKRFPKDTRIIFPDAIQWPGLIADFKYFPGVEPPVLTDGPQNRAEFNEMKERLQPFDLDPKTSQHPELMEKLRQIIEASAICATKNKMEKKQNALAEFNKSTTDALKKMQMALGLRPSGVNEPNVLAPLSATQPAKFSFDQSPVIICVDVEAHEAMKSAVTEVGIATLDTNDIRDTAPGPFGVNWQQQIRSRHLRTSEYRHHTNKQFINGCPDDFQFGTSEFIPQADMARVVGTCFRPPFSATYKSPPTPQKVTIFTTPTDSQVKWTNPAQGQGAPLNPTAPTFTPDTTAEQKRNIILLGHDTDNDVAYLRQIGYDVSNLSNIIHVADTCTLYSALTGNRNKTRLGKILFEVDIEGWYLHNAGNDAWYTLAAAIALCVGDREGRKFGDLHAPAGLDGQVNDGPILEAAAVTTVEVMDEGEETALGDAADRLAPGPDNTIDKGTKGDDGAIKDTSGPHDALGTPAAAVVEEEDLISFDDFNAQATDAAPQNTTAPSPSIDYAPNTATWITPDPEERKTGSSEMKKPDVVMDDNGTKNAETLKENGGFLAYMASRLNEDKA